ncbi:MAG: hypothetical protein G8345_08620 [Magnetococcales bacterium]|nr:hypothetical protein [Magnetococcales bacterium]NGZ26938.1 hypothetical protein [Magnetococcales bacterium]
MAARHAGLLLVASLLSGCVVAHESYRTSPGYSSYSGFSTYSPGYSSGYSRYDPWPDYDDCCGYDFGFGSGFNMTSDSWLGFSFSYHMGGYNPYPWYSYHPSYPWSWVYVPPYYVHQHNTYIDNRTIVQDHHHPNHEYFRRWADARQDRHEQRQAYRETYRGRPENKVVQEERQEAERPKNRWSRRHESERPEPTGREENPTPFMGFREKREERQRQLEERRQRRLNDNRQEGESPVQEQQVEKITPRPWLGRRHGEESRNPVEKESPPVVNTFQPERQQHDFNSRRMEEVEKQRRQEAVERQENQTRQMEWANRQRENERLREMRSREENQRRMEPRIEPRTEPRVQHEQPKPVIMENHRPQREAPRMAMPEPVREPPRMSRPEPVREPPRMSMPEPVRERPAQREREKDKDKDRDRERSKFGH